jgi:hypothetical protein
MGLDRWSGREEATKKKTCIVWEAIAPVVGFRLRVALVYYEFTCIRNHRDGIARDKETG